MARVGARMGEFFTTVGAFEGFLAAMYPQVFLQMMFELKRLVAVVAFEFPQRGALVVTDHMPLQSVYVREALVAYLARLCVGRVQGLVSLELLARGVRAAALATREGPAGAQRGPAPLLLLLGRLALRPAAGQRTDQGREPPGRGGGGGHLLTPHVRKPTGRQAFVPTANSHKRAVHFHRATRLLHTASTLCAGTITGYLSRLALRAPVSHLRRIVLHRDFTASADVSGKSPSFDGAGTRAPRAVSVRYSHRQAPHTLARLHRRYE